MNSILNKFSYGYFYDGHKIEGIELERNNFSHYKTISPIDFMKYKIGICWDYTNFEAWYFNQYFSNLEYAMYYIETNDDKGKLYTHTWLAYYNDDNCIVIESSWSEYAGITKYDNEQNMVKEYVDRFMSDKDNQECVVYTYVLPNKYGMTTDEFIHYIHEGTHIKVYEIGNYELERILPYIDE